MIIWTGIWLADNASALANAVNLVGLPPGTVMGHIYPDEAARESVLKQLQQLGLR